MSVVPPARKRSGCVVHPSPIALDDERLPRARPAAPRERDLHRPGAAREDDPADVLAALLQGEPLLHQSPGLLRVERDSAGCARPASAPSLVIVTAPLSPSIIHGERTSSSYG